MLSRKVGDLRPTLSNVSEERIPHLQRRGSPIFCVNIHHRLHRNPYPEPDQFTPSCHIRLTENTVFNIILSMTMSSNWSFLFRFPYKSPACISVRLSTCPSRPSFDPSVMMFGEIRKLQVSLCSLSQPPVNFLPLGPKCEPQHPILQLPQPMFSRM